MRIVKSRLNFILLITFIGFGLIGQPLSLNAQEKYPTRAIELVIPWPPGGSTDIAGRIFANELVKALKVPVTPVNKAGASGTIGATYVHKARRDGYTLLAGSLGWLLGSITLEGIPYDPLKDFIPIAKISTTPHGLFVRKDSPIRSLEELIEKAKKSPKSISCGTAGTSSDGHFNIEIFQKAAAIELKHVPFKGIGEVPPALIGGHVDIGIGVASAWLPFARAGDVRGLSVTGKDRMKELPDVATFMEKGFRQTFLNNWVGFFAPTGVPPAVVEILIQGSERVVKSKEFVESIEKTGSIVEPVTRAEFEKELGDGRKIGDTIAHELGLKKGK